MRSRIVVLSAVLSAACETPEHARYEWPAGVELAFVLVQSPTREGANILGPFVPGESPANLEAEPEDVLVLALDASALAARYARFSPEDGADIRLEARPPELEECVTGGLRTPAGTRLLVELGAEATFHSLEALDFTDDEARFRESLALSLPMSERCQPPRLVEREFVPGHRWVEGDPVFGGRPVVQSAPSALLFVDEDQVLVGSTWGIATVERGRAIEDDGTHAFSIDHPLSTSELTHGVRGLALGGALASGARRVFSAGAFASDSQATDGAVTEYTLDGAGLRFRRVLASVSPEPMNVVAAFDDGTVIAGGDLVAAGFSETATATWKSETRYRSLIATQNSAMPHAFGAADGNVWVGDVLGGPSTMRSLRLGASTSNVVAFARLSDRVLILQREGLSYAHDFDPWSPVRIPLDLPHEVVECEGANTDACGRPAVSSTFSTLAADEETAWIGSTVCGALLQVRLSDGCTDLVPLVEGFRKTPQVALRGRQLFVTAHPGYLFEFEVQ